MNISNVVRPCKRIERFYSSTLGIQTYDKDNLYPQRMLALLKNSPTGGTCCSRYENFIFGDGSCREPLRGHGKRHLAALR